MTPSDLAISIMNQAKQHHLTCDSLQINLISFMLVAEALRNGQTYPFDEPFIMNAYGPKLKALARYENLSYDYQHLEKYAQKVQLDPKWNQLVNQFVPDLLRINMFQLSDFCCQLPFYARNWSKMYHEHQKVSYSTEQVTLGRSLTTLIQTMQSES